jgi:hypothetical protein
MTVSSTTATFKTMSKANSTPIGGIRFDYLMAGLAAAVIGGLYLDGWAHSHGRVDKTFFTPWHGVLYGALFLNAIVLGIVLLVNHKRGRSWLTALPEGYLLSFIGTPLFLVGGVGDLIWHTLFGFEVGIEPLLSPTHLLLALSGFFIMSGPIRAAWIRTESRKEQNWSLLLPPIISLTTIFSLFTFFTDYAHPFDNLRTITAQPYQGTFGSWGATGILLQSVLLMGIVLFALRRWHLPFGTFTFMFTINAALMSVFRDVYVLILPALLSGIIADILYARIQPSVKRPDTVRMFAFIVPILHMLSLLLTIIAIWGTSWSIHLWLGVCVMGGVIGLLMSYLIVPNPIPVRAEQEE